MPNPIGQYRPLPTGNAQQDLAWKIAFDDIYALRDMVANIQVPAVPSFQEIARQLQLGGVAPINVTGLAGTGNILYGPYELRPFGSNAGTIYIESSRNGVNSTVPYPVFRWSGAAWTAIEGRFARNQAQLTTLTATLTANDANLTVDVLDFGHLMAWNGTGLNYADPSDPPGRVVGFLVDPLGNAANGWAFCNGANVSYLLPDGSTSNVTLPDFTGTNNAFALWANTSSSLINAPVAPVLTMNSYTPTGSIGGSNTFTPSGNVASTFTGDALAAHAHDAPIGDSGDFLTTYTLNVNGNGANYTAISKVVSAADSTANITSRRTSAVSGGTASGNVASTFSGNSNTVNGSSFTFTGNAATLTGSISNNGTPRSWQLRPFFRR